MKVPFTNLAAAIYSMAILTACATQGGRDFSVAPSSALGVITEADVASSHGTTVYEVIERSRPIYLLSKVDLAPDADREVYLNGIRLGGVGELRLIPAKDVKEIRFVRAIDMSAYGVGRSAGAILVFSKAGR